MNSISFVVKDADFPTMRRLEVCLEKGVPSLQSSGKINKCGECHRITDKVAVYLGDIPCCSEGCLCMMYDKAIKNAIRKDTIHV